MFFFSFFIISWLILFLRSWITNHANCAHAHAHTINCTITCALNYNSHALQHIPYNSIWTEHIQISVASLTFIRCLDGDNYFPISNPLICQEQYDKPFYRAKCCNSTDNCNRFIQFPMAGGGEIHYMPNTIRNHQQPGRDGFPFIHHRANISPLDLHVELIRAVFVNLSLTPSMWISVSLWPFVFGNKSVKISIITNVRADKRSGFHHIIINIISIYEISMLIAPQKSRRRTYVSFFSQRQKVDMSCIVAFRGSSLYALCYGTRIDLCLHQIILI